MNRISSRHLLRLTLGLASAALLLGTVVFVFTGRIQELEDRRNALLLASTMVAEWEGVRYPETGIFDSTAVAGSPSCAYGQSFY